MNENSVNDIIDYFNMRVDQMGGGYFLKSTEPLQSDGEIWGMRAVIESTNGNTYQSVFVLENFRSKGLMKTFATENVKSTGIPFWTADECDIADWFRNNSIPFLLIPLTVD